MLVELDADPMLAAVAAALAVANLFVTLVNLVPALPLDWGRVLHAVVWALSQAARRPAMGAGVLVIALIASATGDTPSRSGWPFSD